MKAHCKKRHGDRDLYDKVQSVEEKKSLAMEEPVRDEPIKESPVRAEPVREVPGVTGLEEGEIVRKVTAGYESDNDDESI